MMRSQSKARRSTSALLYDENEKIADAILDQQPLLACTDIQQREIPGAWYQRIYARYGEHFLCFSSKKLLIFSVEFSGGNMGLSRIYLFVYVKSQFISRYCRHDHSSKSEKSIC